MMNENIDHIIYTIKCCFDVRHNVVIMKDIILKKEFLFHT